MAGAKRQLRSGLTAIAFAFAVMPAESAATEFGRPLISIYSAETIGDEAMGWTIVQDQRHVMHFGCNALISFDGDHWRASPIASAYALRGLDIAPNGRLWAAAVNELGWFDPEGSLRWHYHSLLKFLPLAERNVGEVWGAFALSHGAVFVSQDKIFWWNGTSFAVQALPAKRRLTAFRAGAGVFVHHLPTGLYRIDRGVLEMTIPAFVLGEAGVLWMEPQGDGWLLATSKGLFRFVHGRLTRTMPEASAFITTNTLTSAARLPDGRLALGTLRGGIVIANGETGAIERSFGLGSGLPGNEIFSLAGDRQGGLWATSPEAIVRIGLESPTLAFSPSLGLPDRPYVGLAGFGNEVAAATDDEIALLDDGERTIAHVKSPQGHIWNVNASASGLLVSHNFGLDRYTGGAFRPLFTTSQDVFCAVPSRHSPGEILISTGREIVAVGAAVGSSRKIVAGLPDIVSSLAESASGRLWLGTTSAGVLAMTPGASSAVPAGRAFGLPDNLGRVLISAAGDGSILAFSPQGGWLLSSRGGRFRPIRNYPARPAAACSANDGSGRAWVVHPAQAGAAACLGCVEPDEDGGRWLPCPVDGLWLIGTPTSVYAHPSGSKWRLWIGGSQGIISTEIDARALPLPPPPPLVNVLTRSVGDPSDYRLVEAPLPYPMRNLAIDFAIPEYSRRPDLRGETWIESLDSAWVPIGPSGARELSGLRDGRYRIRARSVSNAGQVSSEVTSDLTIRPPWWRTLPADGAFAVLAIVAAYRVYRLRTRALRRRTQDLEALVRQRTEQVDRANASKTEFVATLSHDLRNPLNGVVGLTLALEDTPLDPQQRQLIATIRACTTYLANLTENVLDFSRIEAGQVELHPSTFRPRMLLETASLMLKAQAAAANAQFSLEIAPGLPDEIVADFGRIQEVVVNYAVNALKYAGGRVRLSARPSSDGAREIEFAVEDEGPGISSEEQKRLFTRFGRLSGRKDKLIEGFGMGLFSCQRLAEAMGGRVGVESVLGQGARFFLAVPFGLPTAGSAMAPAQFGIMRVLVVDDAEYNHTVARTALARIGLSVSAEARTGAEALRLLRDERFDLVLLDRNLPDLDGLEIAQKLRQSPPPTGRPLVVGVTAYATAEDRAASLAAGVDAFVGKPLTPEKLSAAILSAKLKLDPTESEPKGDPPGTASKGSIFHTLSDGSEGAAERARGRYLDNLEVEIGDLRQALAAAEGEKVRRAAHRLLASARLVEAGALTVAAERLEKIFRTEAAPDWTEAAQRVADLAGRLYAAISSASVGPKAG